MKTTKLQFGCSGGTRRIDVKSGSDWMFTVSDTSWCHVTKLTNGLKISVDENTTNISRKATIKVSNIGKAKKAISISQGESTNFNSSSKTLSNNIQVNTNSFLVSPNNKRFDAEGGTQTMTVTGSSNWNIGVNVASWAHLNKNGNSLTLTVDSNSSTSSRSDYFTLKSGEKTVRIDFSQDGKSSVPFSVSPNNKHFGAEGGIQTMSVTGSSNWGIDVYVDTWAHLSKNGNSLTLTVDSNSSTSSRSDYFTLKSGEKTVRIDFSQDGQPSIPFSVSPNNKRFGAEGGTQTMTVTGSTNWVIYANVVSWAHLNKNGNNLSLTVDRNNSTSSRSDYFVLKSGEKKFRVDFSQEGQPEVPFSVTPNNTRFDSEGGTQVLTVTGSTNWTIDLSVASWAHLNKNGNSLTLTVDRNNSTTSRRDYFVLKSGEKKLRVDYSQDGKISYLFVGKNNIRVDSKEHFECVSVHSNGDWNVSVAPADWVVFKKNTSSVDLQIKRNRSSQDRSDYFELCLENEVRRINIYQNGRETAWLFRRESGFSSHFLDVQIGTDLFYGLEKYYLGGSYTFVPSHIGFRVSAISEFPYAENLTIDKWILSVGPVIRMTSDASGIDFQAYIGPAFWNNALAWDGGLRFGWHSNNGLSLWDFTLGTLLLDEKVIPTVGMGVGIATSPLIGGGAICFGNLLRHPNTERPHHFFDCNFAYLDNTISWLGLTFDWNPSRIGIHSSSWLHGNGLALILGLNWRLFDQLRLFDIQLFGGVGMITDNNRYFDNIVTYDFGTRINFESHRDFAWYDITIGGLYVNGQIIPTIGCGLGLSSIVGGIGALHMMMR
ncbi:MAG: hypothetical protein MJZ99_05590 [Bacteroidales bacterium]|nr:hypothetical protein [Bacteroidales bacterium]